jgi:hypothetical protein
VIGLISDVDLEQIEQRLWGSQRCAAAAVGDDERSPERRRPCRRERLETGPVRIAFETVRQVADASYGESGNGGVVLNGTRYASAFHSDGGGVVELASEGRGAGVEQDFAVAGRPCDRAIKDLTVGMLPP